MSAAAESVPRHNAASARGAAVAAALILIAAATYAPVTRFDFVNFDDPEYVTGNPLVRGGLSLDGVVWAFTAAHAANWHPLTWISHMLDCTVFGLAPGAHHAVNVVFHIGNTLLVLLFLHRCTGEIWPTALAAALFAVHPLHVESVAWIAERKDVLSTFFFLLALLRYADYVRRPDRARYLLVALAFVLGLLAKPMVVTLPIVLLLLDVWPLRRLRRCGSQFPDPDSRSSGPATLNRELGTVNREPTWKTFALLVIEKLPLFALAAAASAVTFLVQRSSGAVLSFESLPLTFRVTHALVAYAWYIQKTLVPTGLAVFYPMPAELPATTITAAAVLLIAITTAVIVTAKRYPYGLVGWLWFVVTLLPVIGIIKVGDQSTADRFTYIPHIGLFMAGAWGARDVSMRGRWYAAAIAAFAAVVVIGCAAATRAHLAHWRDGGSLFRRALAVTQDNHVAHLNLGQVLAAQERPGEALEQFAEAVRLRPGWARARHYYATALNAVGDKAAALREYEEALRLDPTDPIAHFNSGLLLAERGALDDALAAYTKALQLKPDYVKAQLSMAIALTAQGRRAAAVERYERALQLDPSSTIAHVNLGILLEDMGRRAEAVPHYAEAVRLAPNDPRVHFNLGSALEQDGQRAAAAQHYRNALRAAPDFAPAREALDRVASATGDAAAP